MWQTYNALVLPSNFLNLLRLTFHLNTKYVIILWRYLKVINSLNQNHLIKGSRIQVNWTCHVWSDRKNIKIRTPSHHQVRQILFSDWEDFDQLYVKIDSFHQHPRKQRCVKIVLNHRNQATKGLNTKPPLNLFFFHHFN